MPQPEAAVIAKLAALLGTVIAATGGAAACAAELRPATLAAWEHHVLLTEARIEAELASAPRGFLVQDFLAAPAAERCHARVASGGTCIERLSTREVDGRPIDVPDGLVHHWLGSILVPDADVDSLLAWIQDYDRHSRHYQEVTRSRLLGRDGELFHVFLRLQRKKVVTVHYNTEHAVLYRQHGEGRASSRSEATRIAEVEDAGEADEREKPAGRDRGFFWRLHSYWRFEQAGSCVLVTCESLSLSRDIPAGFGWLVQGFVESVPRESLERTLVSLRDGYRARRGGRRDPRPSPG